MHGSKPRDIALHVVCGKETIDLAALAAATNKVFLNHAPALAPVLLI